MSAIVLVAYVVAYVGIAVFLAGVVARCVLWARMPMHLRWELYPIPREGGRARHGGSYLELPRWWTRPREVSHWRELRAMAAEMLLLVALRKHNPRLWACSFPFHVGLYLVGACTALMMARGAVEALAPGLTAGLLGRVTGAAVIVSSDIGLSAGFLGAVALLRRRLTTSELRVFSTAADYLNLVIIAAVFLFSLVTTAFDPRREAVQSFVSRLVTFRPGAFATAETVTTLVSLSAVLLAALAAYIPLTHMSHFIGKYFAYHSVRWNDEPNLSGGAREATIEGLLQRPVSWAAPHIRSDGATSWADAAMDESKR